LRQDTEHRDIQYEDEIPWKDIIGFFSRNGKLLILSTVILSTASIVFLLRQPNSTQYQKLLSLSVRTTRPPVPSLPELDNSQASAIAAKFLENLTLDQITAQTKHDPITKQIDVTLQSTNANALNNASAKVVRQVEMGFEQIVGKSIDTNLSSLETQIQRTKQVLDQLKQPSGQFSPTNDFRLGAPETQRILYVTALSGLEFDQQYLKQARQNLAKFTAQIVSIQILTESDKPPQSRSLTKMLVITVIASFLISVLAALIREQVLHVKQELSKQKPRGS
jgi:hypothetical protein